MLIFNFNISGLGGGTKTRYLRRCIATEEAKFVCLQETKIVEVIDVACTLKEKKLLWKKLSNCKEASQIAVWCFCVDFNAIRSRSERRGR